MKFPRLDYLLASGPLWKIGLEMFVEGITSYEWYQNLPWSGIIAFSIGVFIALFLNDLRDKNSWVWENYDALFSKFEIEEIVPATRDDAPRRLSLEVVVRAKREIHSEVARLYVEPLFGKNKSQMTYVLDASLGNLKKDQTKKLFVAAIPIPSPQWEPMHPAWGEMPQEGLSSGKTAQPIRNGRYIAEIRLGGQSQRFYFTFGEAKDTHGLYIQYFNTADAKRLLEE